MISVAVIFWSFYFLNPLSANPTKWSNTLEKFVVKLPTNCLSVFDHFVGLALRWLKENKSLTPNSDMIDSVPLQCSACCERRNKIYPSKKLILITTLVKVADLEKNFRVLIGPNLSF